MSSITTTTDPTPLTEAELDTLQSEAMEDRSVERATMLRLIAAARENAGLREEVAALVPLLAGERAHTSQLTCRHIACHNTLMSPGVHTGETTDVVLIGIRRLQETVATLTAERDAALARVAELERKCKLAVEFIEDSSEADCAYPSDPCLRVHISELGHGMCDGCKARRALGYINAPAVFLPDTKETPQ